MVQEKNLFINVFLELLIILELAISTATTKT